MPNKSTTMTLAPIGYVIANRETVITIIPSPMLVNRDFPPSIIPETTFSIPANNKINARKKITEMSPRIGLIKIMIDKISIIIPKPIWAARTQTGDLSMLNGSYPQYN